MLVQYLNIQSEVKQHLMMSLVFIVFILYSIYNQLGVSLWIVSPLSVLCLILVFLILRNQARLRTQVVIQVIEKTNKYKVLKTKIIWIIIPFILYTLLTILHFYIVHIGSGNYMPMVYDYIFGGVLALFFNFYLFKNWHIGICDEGVVIGSRFDAKLIEWDKIETKKCSNNKVELIFKNIPIEKLSLEEVKQHDVFNKLLNYKLI